MFSVRLAGGHLYGKQLFTWLSLVVSLMASFVLSFFPLDVLDEIWDLVESVSEGFLTYSYVEAFLSTEALELDKSKQSTRLELARAKNRKEKLFINLRKIKERISQQIAKMKEIEAEYEVAKADIRRPKETFKDDSD